MGFGGSSGGGPLTARVSRLEEELLETAPPDPGFEIEYR